jgi:glycerol dehydrogenase-like iron-containing ADH family enzyme
MLLAAPRRYLITGRGDQIGCILYTPIDVAEARRRKNTMDRSAAGSTAG